MTAIAVSDVRAGIKPDEVGESMYQLIRELYPICRSITGNGVRETLRRVGEYIPLKLREVPTGTQVFDWTVPKEWNVRDAYVKNSDGIKVIDFKKSSLHVLNYSTPVHKRMSLAELREHLYTLPDHPESLRPLPCCIPSDCVPSECVCARCSSTSPSSRRRIPTLARPLRIPRVEALRQLAAM